MGLLLSRQQWHLVQMGQITRRATGHPRHLVATPFSGGWPSISRALFSERMRRTARCPWIQSSSMICALSSPDDCGDLAPVWQTAESTPPSSPARYAEYLPFVSICMVGDERNIACPDKPIKSLERVAQCLKARQSLEQSADDLTWSITPLGELSRPLDNLLALVVHRLTWPRRIRSAFSVTKRSRNL